MLTSGEEKQKTKKTQVRSMQLWYLWSILHLRSVLHTVPLSVRHSSGYKTEIKSMEYFEGKILDLNLLF